MEGLQAAVDADPSFALAWYRLAAAAAGCALPQAAREMSDRGFEHRGRLSPHDQLVFGAQRAWLGGAVDEAETLFNTITGTWPDDVESWFHLGDLLFHCNPLRGRSAAEAREPFERVVRLEPEHLGALVHLARIAGIEGRREEMIGLAERALRASPEGDQAPAMRALRAHALGDRDAIAAVTAELQAARAITVAIAIADVALYARDLAGAEALTRSFIQVARAPELRALCHILLAHLALARDDRARADAELAEAERLDLGWALETRGLFATLPFLPVEETKARAARDALAAWHPAREKPGGLLVFTMHDELHPAIRAYLLGLLDLRLGDRAGAASWWAELERLRDGADGLVESLAAELAAARARAEGATEEGLRILARSRPRLWFQLTVASPFFSLASRRYLQAELLREAGRTAEAAGWYRSIAERSPWELIYAGAAARALSASG
jgi:predicted Zn-dependent protease